MLQLQLLVLGLCCALSSPLSTVSKSPSRLKNPAEASARVVGPKQALIYDTTLRDGTQGEGISMSVEDKLSVFDQLVEFGFDYVEGGWPGSNPKDKDFFRALRQHGGHA